LLVDSLIIWPVVSNWKEKRQLDIC
jgi:hypothetical protein